MQRILHAVIGFNWYRYFCLMVITAIVLLIGIIIGFQMGSSLTMPSFGVSAAALPAGRI